MPWELSILRVAGAPPEKSPPTKATLGLGTLADVQQQLTAALPGVRFFEESSGAEKLEEAKQCGVSIPESLQFIFASKRSYRGAYEGNGFTFEFSFGKETDVRFAFLDVRGNGDPLPTLHQIMQETGWAIYDLSTSKLIDTTGWTGFTQWRDLCVNSIRRGDTGG